MRKTYRSLLLVSSLLILLSCSKEDVGPQTGDLKIYINVLDATWTLYYELYTEGSLATRMVVSPLREGEVTVRSSTPFYIRDLNAGNYILSIGGSTRSVQVTGGREREYRF
ncbi:hypothetical protein Q0590_06795 [Rhodocytophaga aerolata]|uniref:DUF4397 domain-containing protein n=1 Tax=Rhodocytophaga aerolata TaxID=455078 RepID=A0ABT8R1I8_9BACT|nr:hypothetical protein [Rhodocytophaga aerolata]MDO1445952.1 hypothetical protein [Rhodocytophaga aerolata]